MAKQRQRFNLRALRRWETALVALCLVGLLAWYYVGQKESGAVSEAEAVERRAAAARRDLANFVEENNIESLNKELEELGQVPPPEGLPSHERAQEMGGAIFGKASSLRVTLDSLTTKEQTVRLGDTDFLAMVFDLNAQGTPAALTNFLSLLREFNTAVVEALDIGRSGASAAVHMVIAVPYEVAAPAAPVEEQVVEEEE